MRQKITKEELLSVIDIKNETRTACTKMFLEEGLGGIGTFNMLIKEYGIKFNKTCRVNMVTNSMKASHWIKELTPMEWVMPVERIRETVLLRTGVLPAPATIRSLQEKKCEEAGLRPMDYLEWVMFAADYADRFDVKYSSLDELNCRVVLLYKEIIDDYKEEHPELYFNGIWHTPPQYEAYLEGKYNDPLSIYDNDRIMQEADMQFEMQNNAA